MVIIKWGSPIYMFAAIDVTAIPSFDTQILFLRNKAKLQTIYLLKQIYIIMN